MATIALSGTPFGYSLGMNAFDSLGSAFTSSKKTTGDLQKSLSTLKSKIDMASVAAKTDSSQENVQKAQVREETKSSSLSLAYDKLDALICDVGKVDQRVSGRISEREDDFYKEYSYLKPDCKKSKKERRHEKWAEMRQNFKDFWGGVGSAILNIAKGIGEWCKEHWKALITAIAVIAIALVAFFVFGVELLVVAAIAGLVSLILGVVDIGFMLCTGKDTGDFLREKGLNTLADIADGVQWGCDLVAIVFPMASFAKQSAKYISKFGVKAFLSSTKQSFKLSIKATWNKLFKSGWKDGLKNAFKIFIYDFDDLKRSSTTLKLMDSKQWVSDGTKLVPQIGSKNYDDCIKVLSDLGLDGIPIDKFGNADFDKLNTLIFQKFGYDNGIVVDISNFSDIRGKKYADIGMSNFAQANKLLEGKYGKTLEKLEEQIGLKLTWHEDINLKTLMLLPTSLHGGGGARTAYSHTGGIAVYNFMSPRTTNMIDNFLKVTVPDAVQGIIKSFQKLSPIR